MSRAYTLLIEGYADWELGFVLAGLRQYGQVEVVTIGLSDQVVTSMGGLRVIPDIPVSDLDIDDVAIFILPGGQIWEGSYPKTKIDELLHRLDDAGKPIAAICAATTVVARAGLLRDRKHTSNSPGYMLKMVPEYSEGAHYVDSLAARDQHLITASGLGAIEFATEIFKELDLATPEMRAMWYDAFKHGKYPEGVEPGA